MLETIIEVNHIFSLIYYPSFNILIVTDSYNTRITLIALNLFSSAPFIT